MESYPDSAVSSQTEFRQEFITNLQIDENENTPLLPSNFQNSDLVHRLQDKIAAVILGIFLIVGIIIGLILLIKQASVPTDYYELVKRQNWSELNPQLNLPELRLPVTDIFLTELNSNECYNLGLGPTACLQHIQNTHILKMGEPDIPYNFIVDKNGIIYEGRGWQNATILNKTYISIALLGNASGKLWSVKTALNNFLHHAVRNGKLEPCFKIHDNESNPLRDITLYLEIIRQYC